MEGQTPSLASYICPCTSINDFVTWPPFVPHYFKGGQEVTKSIILVKICHISFKELKIFLINYI